MAKPDLSNGIWASSGAVIDPGGAKTILGWIAEIPPHQTQNWWQERVDEFIFHINEEGIPEWDAATDYPVDAWQKGADGVVYVSIQTPNVNQDPDSGGSPAYWTAISDFLGGGGGGFGINENTQAGSYSLVAGDYGVDNDVTVVYTGTGGHTFTHLTSASLTAGESYTFVEHRGTGLLTVDFANATDAIGALSLGIQTINLSPGEVARFQLTATANVWRLG